MNKKNITGIVLAGGKSSRMGTDKGIIDLNGKKIIQHVLDALIPVVDDIIIIANNNHYNSFGYPVYADIITNCGPMGGIYTGLVNSPTMNNVILSCDIPFITSEMLSILIDQSKEQDYEITIPIHDGKFEPLCAVYSKKCMNRFKNLLENKILKMGNALNYFVTQPILLSNSKEIEKNFINMNTPQDFITN